MGPTPHHCPPTHCRCTPCCCRTRTSRRSLRTSRCCRTRTSRRSLRTPCCCLTCCRSRRSLPTCSRTSCRSLRTPCFCWTRTRTPCRLPYCCRSCQSLVNLCNNSQQTNKQTNLQTQKRPKNISAIMFFVQLHCPPTVVKKGIYFLPLLTTVETNCSE